MATKGPSAPSQPRTLRGEAVKKGTASAGFMTEGERDYCAQCGHPTNTGLPHSHYEGKGANVSAGGAKPIDAKFKLGGK